jgi:ribonuclease P protein component
MSAGQWVKGPTLALGFDREEKAVVRLAIRASHTLGPAVARNRVKRQLRSLIYTHKVGCFPPGNYVLVVRSARKRPLVQIKTELLVLCQQLAEIKGPQDE